MPARGVPTLAFRSPDAERALIRREATERGLTMAGLIRKALMAYGVPLVDASSVRHPEVTRRASTPAQ